MTGSREVIPMWVAMLLTGVFVFALMYGFVYACGRL
jgi:hypothetical protein